MEVSMADRKSIPDIISRKDAKEMGLTRYFTGHHCKHGHVCERYVYNAVCVRCLSVSRGKWAKENKEHRARAAKRWRRSNPASSHKSVRKYKNHQKSIGNLPKSDMASKKKWRINNYEYVRRINSEWRANNKDKIRVYVRNRRALRIGNGGSHTSKDIIEIIKMQHDRCAICRGVLSNKYHVDHIVPLTSGGTNDRRNLQILCVSCNLRKGRRDPVTYMQSLGFLL
jgi:5-methylcytosine-specific restriction endonuclease McrA